MLGICVLAAAFCRRVNLPFSRLPNAGSEMRQCLQYAFHSPNFAAGQVSSLMVRDCSTSLR